MKFKFCSDGDCPLWALAALHALSSLPAQLFRRLVECVVEAANDDAVIEIMKDTSLSSRDESARAAAVIRWTLQQAWSSNTSGSQLCRDLVLLGVPRSHATVLAEAADNNNERRARELLHSNRLSDIQVSPGPDNSIDIINVTFYTTSENKHDVLMDKTQARELVNELKKARSAVDELE